MPVDLSLFEAVEANIRTLSIDEIKETLEPIKVGYEVRSPIFDPGAFVYRARKLGPSLSKADGIAKCQLIYPPSEKASLGRANRAGSPVFYSSANKESVFFELPDLDTGDELVLTFWKTTEKMVVNNIGYTEYAFKQLGATRALPTWAPTSLEKPGSTESRVGLSAIPAEIISKALSHDDNREVKEAFSRYFARHIAPNEAFRYKLTVALAEMHLGTIVTNNSQFAGILYPSVRMNANGDNVALLPWFVDEHLEFRKAVHVRIKDRKETSFNIDYVDAAHEFDSAGNLAWLGRTRHWTLRPQASGKFTPVVGRDSDGDYATQKDGTTCYWEGVDLATGERLQMV